MNILIDGNRSTSENWLLAHRLPLQELPAVTADELRVAEKLAISPEDYSRSKYAAELTKRQLQTRALRVGQLVSEWLHRHRIAGAVSNIWLKTFDGKFRVEVELGSAIELFFVTEDLINDVLDTGSKEAQQNFDRLLTTNFSSYETARAS